MNITDNNTSYLLKLDDIDVNYITNISFKYEGASCPLWSTNSAKNSRSNEFFEFKVMAGKKSDSATESVTSQGDDTIGYPMYRCVLCNRDIPLTYKKEHNSSTKHKICLKIAEAVLQRIQGHLLAEDNNEIVKGSTHTYFCTPCTVIVKNTDKTLHEASNGHQKSLLHDRYLNDLLNVYLDKDYLDSAEMQYLKPSQDQKDNEDSSLPLRSDSEKVNDKASLMNKIKIHGQNFGKNEEPEPVKKKPTYGPIILKPINHSVGNKNDSSDDDSTVTTNEIVKKKRNRPTKDQRQNFNLKDDLVVEKKNSVNMQNCSMDGMTLFRLRKLSRRFEQNDSASEKITAPTNKKSVADVIKKFNSLNKTNPLINDSNKSVFEQNRTINDQNGSIKDQNQTINDQNKTINDESSSNDEEYHSFDETIKTDEKQYSIEDQNESAEEQSHSNDDINNKTDEKHSPLANQNNLIADQSNETKPNSKTVDYIMLVNSNEFDVDAKTENKDQKSILSKADLETYLNQIIVLFNQKLTLINNYYIKIQTLDGCMVTVRADNFNGLCSRDGWLQCRICMTMVDEDPVQHIYSTDHVVNVGEPFKDIHCFRKINNTFNHCVHCNDTFSNFDFHKLLESHLTALNEALSRCVPEKPIEPKKVGRTSCEPCNLYIDSHNFNSHTNGRPHKNNLALFFTKDVKKTSENVPSTSTDKTYCQKCKNYVNTANFAAHKNQHAKTDTAVVDTKNSKSDEGSKIHCEPCNWEIRKENFQAHLFGKTHQMNLSLVNESNGLLKENYCATCDLYTDKLSTHLTGEYHEFHVKKANAGKKKIDEAQTPSSLVSGTNVTNQIKHLKNETVCIVCNVKVPGNAQNITGHLEGRAHKMKFNEFVNNNRIVVVNNTFYCEICKCSVELTKVIDHILSQTHKNAAPELSNKKYCGKCNIYLLTADWARHSSEVHSELQNNSLAKSNNVETPTPSSTSETNSNYQMKVTADNQALCKICNAKVPNKADSITEHINGRNHKTKFNTLLDENKIKKVNKKFFCEACEATVEQSEELEHIKAKSHKSALSVKPQSSTQKNPSTLYHCECCEVDILNTPSSIQEHEEALGHKISEAFYKVARGLVDNSLHYHYEKIANSVDTVSCRLCNITLSVENCKKHLESPAHNYKYRTTLNENKVQKVNNKYFCQICSVDVQNREELKHIRSLTHLFEKQVSLSVNSQSSTTSTTSGYRCAVCQVDVPNNPKNIKMHEQGSSHMSKLKSLSFDDEEKVLLTKRPSGREMVCSLCKTAVPVSGVSDHVRGARHRANKVVATTKAATT